MEKMFYLLSIGVFGMKSIKKEVRLNFYKKTVDKDFEPEKYRIKAIYGENGSGKSALITAVKIFQDLIVNDNYLAEAKNQKFLHEIINKSTKEFRFNCEYLVDMKIEKQVFSYEFVLGLNERGNYEIKHEVLKVKSGNYPNNRYKVIYESRNGELVQISCDESEKAFLENKSQNLLSAKSFVIIVLSQSSKEQAEVRNGIDDFWFQIILLLTLVVSIKVYIGEEDQHELYFLKKQIRDSRVSNAGILEEGIELGKNLDIIVSVNERTINKNNFEKYQERIIQLTQFIKIFKPDLVSIDIDKRENGDAYECELNLNYGEYSINREFESTGIKKLIRLFDCFAAASIWGIVFIDEMDSNLNDVYLCKLLEYFMYYGSGQLCFTTHNLDPMSVLKENKNSIDFLSSDNHLVSWTARGNATPENCYKNGLIEDSPFNIDATDFVGIFGE
ncbi:MAG: ATP-binding protein [Lachnospiraceae bacterium]|nr:ATP-binding protein [Lachnospiraceae bacterium]